MTSVQDAGSGQLSLLGFCGLFCGGCRNYQGNPGDFQYLGCRAEARLAGECPTRTCAEGRGLVHCGQCDGFPCSEFDGFYRDGKRHHALAFENIKEMRKAGPEKWLAEQDRKHTCGCGARLTWFEARCPNCMK